MIDFGFSTLNPWIQIWIITITELVADLALKASSLQPFAPPHPVSTSTLFFAGIGLYLLLALELSVGFKTLGIAWLNGAWDGSSSIMTTLAGAVIGEQLKPIQWLGLGLIASGMFCL